MDVSAILPSLVTTVALDLLLIGIFALLYRRDRAARHLRLWAVGWLFAALSHVGVVMRMDMGTSVLFGTALVAVTVASALLIFTGAFAFIGRPTPRWIFALVAIVGFLAPIGEALALPIGVTAVPAILTIAAAYGVTGAAVLRPRPRGPGEWLAGLGLVLVGVHCFDFPFFVERPALFPIGLAVFAFQQSMIGLGFVMMYFDRARRDLAASEARHRALFENAVVGAFRCDDEGRFVAVNPMLARMLGHERPESLLGEAFHGLFVDDQERSRLSGLFKVEGMVDGVDFRWRRQDGSVLTVSLHVRQVREVREGGSGHIEGLARDVTDSRRLRRRLAESERLEALGRLAGGVAHDFNNLLTVILTNASLLDDPGLGPRSREARADIIEAAQRGGDLVRQLFLFGRAAPAPAERVDVRAIAERCLRILGPSLGERVRARVVCEGAARVDGSAVQIEQVIMNLALNGRDAMPEGGALTVRIVQVSGVGSTAATREGRWFMVEVADEGVGMDEATRERVFEPFFTTKEAGTGLGLPTVYGIATQLGGEVEIDSAPGAGTRVRVFLPAAT